MRRVAGSPSGLLGSLLAVGYLAWAVVGVRSGLAQWRAFHLEADARWSRVEASREAWAVGADRADILWLAAESSLGVWDDLTARKRDPDRAERILEDASGCYLEASSLGPSSGWPWTGLAGVYARAERAQRERRTTDLSKLSASPWRLVGRDGRIAVGLVRNAIEREPETAAHRDDLALLLRDLGLRDEALAAFRESARVQPVLLYHPTVDVDALPRAFLEAFEAASRAVLGSTPAVSRGEHLVSLGLMSRKLGRLDQAESDFRAALAAPISSLARAEANYHLGGVLLSEGRLDDAARRFDDAAREPVFALGRAVALADIWQRRGDLSKALEFLREARRLDPANAVWRCMEIARVAALTGEHDEALGALKWAVLTHPDAVEAWQALVRAYLSAGDRAGAERELGRFRRRFGDGSEAQALRREIEVFAATPKRGNPPGSEGRPR